MAEFYSRIFWLNKSESLATPLGKTNLNKMDSAIKILDGRTVELYTEAVRLNTAKADRSQLNNLLTGWAIDNASGIVTLTRYDGTKVSVNTALNKLAVNFVYDAITQRLIITQSDGTKQYVDMAALLTQYEFLNTDTIAITVNSDGKVSAEIRSGSITREMLSPNVLAEIVAGETNIQAQVEQARHYAENAATDALLAQSYAVDGTGIRSGEKEDNAKYYKEQAEQHAAMAGEYRDQGQSYLESTKAVLEEIIKKTTMAEFGIDDTGHLVYTDTSTYNFTVQDDGNLYWEVVT